MYFVSLLRPYFAIMLCLNLNMLCAIFDEKTSGNKVKMFIKDYNVYVGFIYWFINTKITF